MQELRNRTPYAIAVAPFVHKDGRSVAAVIVKGTFDLNGSGRSPVLAEEQVPVGLADDHFEDDETPSSLRYASEAVPAKRGTDVAIIGHAYPRQGFAKTLDVQLQVGPLQQRLRVFGDRVWRRSFGSWKISDPMPFDKMPLRYEFAFGGQDTRHEDQAQHNREPRNPIGTGFSVNGGKGDLEGLKLPNLEHPPALIKGWKDRPPVVGFGFIDGSWEPRIHYAGTYDDKWEKTRNPLLPDDFDDRFYNAAHPDLVAVPHLTGGEAFRLINATKNGELTFNLPTTRLGVGVMMNDRLQTHPSVLDTVVVEPDEQRLMLTWRATFDCSIDLTTIEWVDVREETQT